MVEKRVHYPTENEFKHNVKEVKTPSVDILTKRSIKSNNPEILSTNSKITATKKRSKSDELLEFHLEKERLKNEAFVRRQTKKHKDEQI